MRLRILFGTLILVVGLVVYALAVMMIAVSIIPDHWAVASLFYLVTGIAWVYPAAHLTRWMQNSGPPRPLT